MRLPLPLLRVFLARLPLLLLLLPLVPLVVLMPLVLLLPLKKKRRRKGKLWSIRGGGKKEEKK